LKGLGIWKGQVKSPDSEHQSNAAELDKDDDRSLRFTIGGKQRRLTKEEFLTEIQTLGQAAEKPIEGPSSEEAPPAEDGPVYSGSYYPLSATPSLSATSDYQESSLQDQFPKAESTLPTTVSGAAASRKEEDFDTQSILTDNQSLLLPEDTKQPLINVFATEIVRDIQDILDEQDGSANRISDALPELLKEFSQDLSPKRLFGIQKDAAVFVRHYRKYVGLYPF
jgi:hypothetical protein